LSLEAVSAQRSALAAALVGEQWKVEHVELVTVGIDVGSSTSHLMFSRVHLQREAQSLSSRFVVAERATLWRSPIVLTPYLDEQTIDAEALGEFVAQSYRQAGIERADVDTGAVILTGEAVKRRNARALAELFADESGKFVCASAGHHMESAMAAHGSGAVELSLRTGRPLLHVDIGGGTSKLALVSDGEVIDTAAVAVGGRLLAFDGALATRVDTPAVAVAEHLGVELAVDRPVSGALRVAIAETLADALAELITGGARSALTNALLVTDPPAWPVPPTAISVSGGVAEYVYGRERRRFGDLAPELADALGARLREGRLPLLEPLQGIRATVIGASQFSVQVSGNTVNVSDPRVLPKRAIPVLYPTVDLSGTIEPGQIAERIVQAGRRMDLLESDTEVALGFAWDGDPSYARLRALAEGVLEARDRLGRDGDALILLLEGDVASSLGHLLREELSVTAPTVCLDGLELREFDYVDIGSVIEPTGVVPVVIKSLLFGSAGGRESRGHGAHAIPAATGR
jgi:ethanolamine utilization protein EutA